MLQGNCKRKIYSEVDDCLPVLKIREPSENVQNDQSWSLFYMIFVHLQTCWKVGYTVWEIFLCLHNQILLTRLGCNHLFTSKQSVTNIFEYTNIWIYLSQMFIRSFVHINFYYTNIFGHSFMSNLFIRIYSDIGTWVCKNVKNIGIFECIQIFIRFYMQFFSLQKFLFVKFLMYQIYSNIHSCKFSHAKIFGHLFV